MSDVNVEESFVDVPGGRVFVRWWQCESTSTPHALLLHDSFGSVDQWRAFPRIGALMREA